MRKILLHNVGLAPLVFDQNEMMCTSIDSKYKYSTYNIEYIYTAPEDLEIRYKDGKNTVVKNVDKGDVVVKFPNECPNPIVILKNKDFKENLLQKITEIEKARAANTERENLKNYCCDCDSICEKYKY